MTTTVSPFIAGMPKAELHMHLEGSLEPATLMELAARNRVQLPYADAAELQRAYRFDDLKSFLDLYYLGLTVLLTSDDFYRMTYAYLARASRDNVRHAEVFLAPQAHLRRGLAMPLFIDPVLTAFADARAAFGITGGLIPVIQRQFDEADALAMIAGLAPWRDRILGIGLGGPELGNPPGKFRQAFARARGDYGWHATAHAGEEGGPDYVREAVEILAAERIDHGVRCAEDPELMRLLAERGLPLTVCPLSNVMLRVFPDMRSHNVRALYDAGLHITINSDDPPYFGGFVNENYAAIQAAHGFGDAELRRLARNGVTAAFVADEVREQYLSELDRFDA
jgi:adenosine deaminase